MVLRPQSNSAARVSGRGENRTRIRRQHAFVQVTTLVDYGYGRAPVMLSSRDNTPLTRKNWLWRRIPVQNPSRASPHPDGHVRWSSLVRGLRSGGI